MSGTCGMSDEKGRELPVDVDALAKSLEASINEVRLAEEHLTKANSKSGKGKQSSIPIVPELLQGGESEAYKPKILSLGPYHHHESHLQAMKQLKLLYIHRFLDRNRNISLHQYLTQVKERESEARMAYEDCNMTGNDLIEMLLLDSCFVLEIIWFWNNASDYVRHDDKDTYNPLVRTRYSFMFIVRDMLLLENQLPFFLIRHLFNSAYSSRATKSLEELIIEFFRIIIPSIMKVPSIGNNGSSSSSSGKSKTSRDFLHILHIIHCSISPENIRQDDPRKRVRDLTWGCCCRNHAGACSQDKNMDYWIPCAVELRNAGIHFVIRDEKERHSEIRVCSFLDITFEEGRMAIPKLEVDDNTEMILRNLIAFEQCCVEAKPHVTAYAMLMDCIINTEADVELLQQRGVLVNGLGDSKEVAILFNKLCKEVALPNECYTKVFDDVHRHCRTECNRWRAKLNHDYFSNPWAIISLIAAFLLFVLTITQTVFSVLSYVKSK